MSLGWKRAYGKRRNWSKAVADPKYIENLRNVIFQRHGCKSSWIESLPVHDVFNGQIVWDGIVEVFRLTGHPADSDESGHLFQSMSDTIPILSDSCRSEATL